MNERDAVEEPEEPGSLPPDYDAPGQVDYPDPAFDEADEADLETPDEGEPEPEPDEDHGNDEDDDEDE